VRREIAESCPCFVVRVDIDKYPRNPLDAWGFG
jgi:hypothetical protein